MIKTNYELRNPKWGLKKYILDNFNLELFKIINDIDPKSILAAGCGEGFEFRTLKKKGFLKNRKVIGIDISKDALKIAKKDYPEISFFQGDIYKLDFKDNSFDFVMCCETLEHLKKPILALKECKRVSKKYILVTIPNQPLFRISNLLLLKYIKNLGDFPTHLHSWTKSKFANLLKPHFKIMKIKTSYFWNIFLLKK